MEERAYIKKSESYLLQINNDSWTKNKKTSADCDLHALKSVWSFSGKLWIIRFILWPLSFVELIIIHISTKAYLHQLVWDITKWFLQICFSILSDFWFGFKKQRQDTSDVKVMFVLSFLNTQSWYEALCGNRLLLCATVCKAKLCYFLFYLPQVTKTYLWQPKQI